LERTNEDEVVETNALATETDSRNVTNFLPICISELSDDNVVFASFYYYLPKRMRHSAVFPSSNDPKIPVEVRVMMCFLHYHISSDGAYGRMPDWSEKLSFVAGIPIVF